MPSYHKRLVAAPAELAVSLEQAKEHLGLATSRAYLDNQVRGFIQAATELAQGMTGRQFVSASYEYSFARFPVRNPHLQRRYGERSWHPEALIVPDAPVASITDVQYVDTEGNLQPLTPRTEGTEPMQLYPPAGEAWPDTAMEEPWTVRVTAVVGYGSNTTDVPDLARVLLCQIVDHLFHNRSGMVTQDAQVNRLAESLQWGAEFVQWPPAA